MHRGAVKGSRLQLQFSNPIVIMKYGEVDFFFMEHLEQRGIRVVSINRSRQHVEPFALWIGLDCLFTVALDNGMESAWSARHARATLYYYHESCTEFKGDAAGDGKRRRYFLRPGH